MAETLENPKKRRKRNPMGGNAVSDLSILLVGVAAAVWLWQNKANILK